MGYDPATRTRTLARLLGPYFLVVAAMFFVRMQALATILPAFMENGALVLVTGAFTLMLGLLIIGAHHHWTSPPAIAISLIGSAAALKGAWLMIAPELGVEATQAFVDAPAAMLAAAAFELAVGLWLTFVGWFAKPAT